MRIRFLEIMTVKEPLSTEVYFIGNTWVMVLEVTTIMESMNMEVYFIQTWGLCSSNFTLP